MRNEVISTEQEVRDAMHAMAEAQQLLAGTSALTRVGHGSVWVGWYGHDSDIDSKIGAFAYVRDGSEYSSLIGDVIRVSHRRKEVAVYVMGAAPFDDDVDIVLQQIAFTRLAVPATERVRGTVRVYE